MKQPYRALRTAIARAGGPTALARRLGVSKQAIVQWRQAPPLRVLELERLSGVPRHELRPDLYPVAREREPATT